MHECKVLYITTAYNKLSIPYVVNHLTKAISGEVTAKKIMSNQAIQRHVYFHHSKNRLINIGNSVVKDTSKCSSSCEGCTERDSMCDSCNEKGAFSKNPVLRPCSYCLRNELKDVHWRGNRCPYFQNETIQH